MTKDVGQIDNAIFLACFSIILGEMYKDYPLIITARIIVDYDLLLF